VKGSLGACEDAMAATRRTLKRDGNLLGRNDFHGNGLLISVEVQVLDPRPSALGIVLVVAVIVSAATASALARQYGAEFAICGRGFGACFFFLLRFGVEAREEVADDKVCYQRLLCVSESK
jgi:hypothetical protein